MWMQKVLQTLGVKFREYIELHLSFDIYIHCEVM